MHVKKSSKTRTLSRDYIKLLKTGSVPANIHKDFLLRHLKYSLSASEADKVIEALDDDVFNFVTAYPIAVELSELFREPGIFMNIPGKEISWITKFLVDYNTELTFFVELEREYNQHFLLGNYARAREIVDEIDIKISNSVWSMQQKLFLAEAERGFVGNKDLLSQFLSSNLSTITNFNVHYTSIRAERNISASQYEVFVDNYIKMVGIDLQDYVYFKVDFFRKFDYDNPEFMLYVDGRLSIIDRFITFKQLAKIKFSEKKSDFTSPIWKSSVLRVANAVKDPELNILCNLLGQFQEVSSLDEEFLALTDAYTLSQYSLVIQIAERLIPQDPNSFHAILLYVKSNINLSLVPSKFGKEDCVLDQVVYLLFHLLSKDNTFNQESYFDMFKLIHQLGNQPLAVGLFQVLNEELPYRFPSYGEIDFFKFYVANSRQSNPAFYQYLEKRSQLAYLDRFRKSGENHATISLIDGLNDPLNMARLSEFTIRELKYHAIVLKNKLMLKEALRVYEHIFSSKEFISTQGSLHLVLDILIGKFNCLIQMDSIGSALELAVDSVTKHPHFKMRFFNPALLKIVIDTEDERLQGNICLPIYLAYYKESIESYDLYVSYDNYISILGYEKPRDLIQSYEDYDQRDLGFLMSVCTHDVLHSSPEFENQEELDLERLEICNFLLDKVDDHLEIESEISDLLRKILVRKGIKQINYSKIYVDVTSLKEGLQKELRENFNRNIEIAALPIDQLNKIVDSVGKMLVYYVDNPEDPNDFTQEDLENVKLTSYSRFLHFQEAFLKVRDRFIFDKDHGLDTYLSMRIRHGTLLGQIRSVFETNHLITVRDEIENAYIPNDFWLSRMSELDNEDNEILNEAFNNFSKAIDKIAETLKLQTIQIITEMNNGTNGLFDFSYDRNQLLKLFSVRFGSIKEYDLFIEEVIQELWRRTETCLSSIKLYLNNQLISKIESVFDELETNVNSINIKGSSVLSITLQELISTITNCRTAIVVEIGNISEWFNRSNKKIIEEFDFSVLAESSVNTLQTINPLFKDANIRYDIDCYLRFDGDLFPYFTDILYYLLDNAIKHSRLASEELWISIDVKQEGDQITITVKNNIISDPTYLTQVEERILATREKIKADVTYERINKEGGTGVPKIKKTLKHDLKRKANNITLQLSEVEGTHIFTTRIEFDIKGLLILK